MKTASTAPDHRNQRARWWSVMLAIVACLATWLAVPPAASADNIDDELLDQAPRILEYLDERGYTDVGVLPFLFQKGHQRSTFHGGLLAKEMAERLAGVLILKRPSSKAPLNIIGNAASVANRQLASASYRTASDRATLFRLRYPLDWGGEVTPDIFLSGKVTLSSDLRTTTVSIGAFERRSPAVVCDLLEFTVPTDRYMLAASGEGFSVSKGRPQFVRGFADDEILDSVEADKSTKEKADTLQSRDTGSTAAGFPVTLSIFYDGVKQDLKPDPKATGKFSFTAPDPEKGQRVTFGVRNETGATVGAVLTVNGISTLHEKRGKAKELPKWILEPHKYHVIKGYHKEDHLTYTKIEGLSDDESKAIYADLGGVDTGGVIHLYVFSPKDASGGAPAFTRSVGLLSDSELADMSLRSFADLRNALAKKSVLIPSDVRGLAYFSLEEGKETLDERKLGPVELLDTMTVRYYTLSGDSAAKETR